MTFKTLFRGVGIDVDGTNDHWAAMVREARLSGPDTPAPNSQLPAQPSKASSFCGLGPKV